VEEPEFCGFKLLGQRSPVGRFQASQIPDPRAPRGPFCTPSASDVQGRKTEFLSREAVGISHFVRQTTATSRSSHLARSLRQPWELAQLSLFSRERESECATSLLFLCASVAYESTCCTRR
jgi:hypothetical protein